MENTQGMGEVFLYHSDVQAPPLNYGTHCNPALLLKGPGPSPPLGEEVDEVSLHSCTVTTVLSVSNSGVGFSVNRSRDTGWH